MAKVIAIWGVVAIASAIIAGIVASAKRRDHSFWAAWSFLVPPMLLILLLMPANKGPRARRPGIDEVEDKQAY
jgi:H+/Cl- antiporter ClcA